MPVLRNTKQGVNESVLEFYQNIAKRNDAIGAEYGKSMLSFVEMVNATFPKTTIWGLTSRSSLVLQREDRWDSQRYIIITPRGSEYEIEYLMTENKKPWNLATVSGTATTLIEARKYLLIAMRECGAWADNGELLQILNTEHFIQLPY